MITLGKNWVLKVSAIDRNRLGWEENWGHWFWEGGGRDGMGA